MCQPGLSWLQLPDQSQGGIKVQVGGMWFASQDGKDEGIKSLQQRATFCGNRGNISAEGNVLDPEPEDIKCAVTESDGQDLQAQEWKWFSWGDFAECQPRGCVLMGVSAGVGKRVGK